MNDNVVEIDGSIILDKNELKDVLMGDVIVANKDKAYDWDSIIEEGIAHGIDLENQSITLKSKDWVFIYHLETLDQLAGFGM